MLIQADARSIPLRDNCVQCVVTSPPYFGLRDYGIAGQIGLEPTPDAYVAQIVDVFREVRRVLKDDGVCWLNLGDSYATQPGKGDNVPQTKWQANSYPKSAAHRSMAMDVAPKNLLGMPWRVAFALQADGWYLRSDVIWAKPNPMPESVTDRPTKSHEYIFLLTKSARYYYDADAIKEKAVPQKRTGKVGYLTPKHIEHREVSIATGGTRRSTLNGISRDSRNKRSVWTVGTTPFAEAHFATMPILLVEPCILAGSRAGDLVFDPFIGAGTVGLVAEYLSRRWVGTDLNGAYHQIAATRTAQRGLMFQAAYEEPELLDAVDPVEGSDNGLTTRDKSLF